MMVEMPADGEFALCLTHDVDRPYKTWFQGLYYATKENPRYHLSSVLSSARPYWQFDRVTELEDRLGVRSAFYFLDEPSQLQVRTPRELLEVHHLADHLGRYDVTAPEISALVRRLDDSGWEVGLHGSSTSYRDAARLRDETRTLERQVGHRILGGRQHYLNLDVPRTWRYQADAGLRYDTSLGSSTEYGFDHGYHPKRPFDDDFVVFPLTLMECALPDPATRFEAAWRVCDRLLEEAADNGAVMTVLWHPRYFNPVEFEGYGRLYRRLIEAALERGAWVGSPGALYERLVAAPECAVGSA
jgi:hypothetical protein